MSILYQTLIITIEGREHRVMVTQYWDAFELVEVQFLDADYADEITLALYTRDEFESFKPRTAEGV